MGNRRKELNRVNPIGQGPEDDEFVWDHSAGHVFPPQRIWETQRHLLADAVAGFRLILDTREEGVLIQGPTLRIPVKEKPDPRSAHEWPQMKFIYGS